PTALAIVPIPGLEMSAAAPRYNPRPTVAVDCIGQHPLVCRIDVEHRHAAAPAAHEADRRRVGELAGDLGAAGQSKTVISADHWPLVGIDRKRSDTMSRVIGLPILK